MPALPLPLHGRSVCWHRWLKDILSLVVSVTDGYDSLLDFQGGFAPSESPQEPACFGTAVGC